VRSDNSISDWPQAKTVIRADLQERHFHWLGKAAEAIAEATQEDWKQWRKDEQAVRCVGPCGPGREESRAVPCHRRSNY
jgi:hypothetical protein